MLMVFNDNKKCKFISNWLYLYLWFLAYRDKGTGEPCARHNRPIPFLICLSIQLRLISVDSEGALTPTGSIGNYTTLLKERINLFEPERGDRIALSIT